MTLCSTLNEQGQSLLHVACIAGNDELTKVCLTVGDLFHLDHSVWPELSHSLSLRLCVSWGVICPLKHPLATQPLTVLPYMATPTV